MGFLDLGGVPKFIVVACMLRAYVAHIAHCMLRCLHTGIDNLMFLTCAHDSQLDPYSGYGYVPAPFLHPYHNYPPPMSSSYGPPQGGLPPYLYVPYGAAHHRPPLSDVEASSSSTHSSSSKSDSDMKSAGERGNEGAMEGVKDVLQASNAMTTGTATATKDSVACQQESRQVAASAGGPHVVNILVHAYLCCIAKHENKTQHLGNRVMRY